MESGTIGPINIGNPGEFTILELANKVIKITNSKSKIIHKELPIDDPTQRKPDITLAKNILKWTPKIQLEEGLIKTINYFKWLIKKENKKHNTQCFFIIKMIRLLHFMNVYKVDMNHFFIPLNYIPKTLVKNDFIRGIYMPSHNGLTKCFIPACQRCQNAYLSFPHRVRIQTEQRTFFIDMMADRPA